MYDRPPRMFGLSALYASPTISMEQWLLDRQTVTALIKQHLNRAVLRMKFR
jgi:hypothetical protein